MLSKNDEVLVEFTCRDRAISFRSYQARLREGITNNSAKFVQREVRRERVMGAQLFTRRLPKKERFVSVDPGRIHPDAARVFR